MNDSKSFFDCSFCSMLFDSEEGRRTHLLFTHGKFKQECSADMDKNLFSSRSSMSKQFTIIKKQIKSLLDCTNAYGNTSYKLDKLFYYLGELYRLNHLYLKIYDFADYNSLNPLLNKVGWYVHTCLESDKRMSHLFIIPNNKKGNPEYFNDNVLWSFCVYRRLAWIKHDLNNWIKDKKWYIDKSIPWN